ncbi:MAG: hypothetical protein Q4A54_14645, partial [Parabacteroides sp.]|nr:hypothetical protein [Parabacteroides sp.]
MEKRILSSLLTAILIFSLFTAMPVTASMVDISSIAVDYVAGEVTGNCITAETLSPNYNAVSEVRTSNAGTENEAWVIGANAAVEDNFWGVGGAIISKNGYDNSILAAGKSIAIGAKVRKTKGNPVIKTSAYQYNKSPILPVEYSDSTSGKAITNTEWEDFGATLKFPETGFMGANNTNLLIGFAPTTIKEEREIEILKGSVYIGEEYAYDMNITADGTVLMFDKTVNVSANVLN